MDPKTPTETQNPTQPYLMDVLEAVLVESKIPRFPSTREFLHMHFYQATKDHPELLKPLFFDWDSPAPLSRDLEEAVDGLLISGILSMNGLEEYEVTPLMRAHYFNIIKPRIPQEFHKPIESVARKLPERLLQHRYKS
jgi:hypothetical protein